MKPKYLLCPGVITSVHDGQLHYVGPFALATLYGVDYRECKLFDPQQWWPDSFWREAERDRKNLIVLAPRADGDYTLPPNAELSGAGMSPG